LGHPLPGDTGAPCLDQGNVVLASSGVNRANQRKNSMKEDWNRIFAREQQISEQ
jgi:hypothetical protein